MDNVIIYIVKKQTTEGNMELSPRLEKITTLIPKGSTLADIGTDHAYIPVYCAKNKITKSALAMDLNEGPLSRADINIKKYGFEEKIRTRLSDGLSNLLPGEADVIVIAGMGGLLIRDIIEKGKTVIDDNTILILQPMIAPVELRQFLYSSGFNIEDEYVVREEDKFYNIFKVKKGNFSPSDSDLYIGKNLSKNSPDEIDAYLDYKIRVCKKIVDGMKKSDNPDVLMLKKYEAELEIYILSKKESSK